MDAEVVCSTAHSLSGWVFSWMVCEVSKVNLIQEILTANLAIFNATAPGTGTSLTDAVDGDVGSVCDSSAGACPGTTLNRVTVGNTTGLTPAQANGALSIAANKTFAIRFRAVKK